MTHRQIINRALLAIGSSPVTGVVGTTDPIHIAVSAAYEPAWREVLESNAWSDLLALSSIDADADDDDVLIEDADGLHRFTIPSDCVQVVTIKNDAGKVDRKAVKRGSYIWSDQETIRLTYLSGDGLVPVDMSVIDTDLEPPHPSMIIDAVAYRLAAHITFSLTQNTALQSSMDARYYNALSIAKANDMRPSGGEDFWGHRTTDDEL